MSRSRIAKQYQYDSLPRGEVSRGELLDISTDEFNAMLDAAAMTSEELRERLGIPRAKFKRFPVNGYPNFVVQFLKMKANVRMLSVVADYTGYIENKHDLMDMLARNGVTYGNIAKLLNVSIHTVKRWIASEPPKYAAETMVLFLLIGDVFYSTYGLLRRRDFHPAHLRYKRFPKGTKNLDSSPRKPVGVGIPRSGVGKGLGGRKEQLLKRDKELKEAQSFAKRTCK
jgi:hypothetical protein